MRRKKDCCVDQSWEMSCLKVPAQRAGQGLNRQDEQWRPGVTREEKHKRELASRMGDKRQQWKLEQRSYTADNTSASKRSSWRSLVWGVSAAASIRPAENWLGRHRGPDKPARRDSSDETALAAVGMVLPLGWLPMIRRRESWHCRMRIMLQVAPRLRAILVKLMSGGGRWTVCKASRLGCLRGNLLGSLAECNIILIHPKSKAA